MELHALNSFTSWLLVLLLGATVVFSYCRSYFSKRASLLRRFVGPKGLPIIGVPWVLSKPERIFTTLLEWDKKYGAAFYMSIGPKVDIISLSAPEDLEKILTSNKSYLYGNVRPWLGDGVLISKAKTLLIIGFWALVTWKTNAGKKWEERLKMIALSFHFPLLNEQFQQTFHDESKQLVDIIQENIDDSEKADGAVLEMHSVFTKLTLDVLCETAMARKLDCLRDPNNAFLKATIRATQLLMKRYAA